MGELRFVVAGPAILGLVDIGARSEDPVVAAVFLEDAAAALEAALRCDLPNLHLIWC